MRGCDFYNNRSYTEEKKKFNSKRLEKFKNDPHIGDSFYNKNHGRFPNCTQLKQKFRWHDGYGRKLTAGGLLPYDDDGIWVIGETGQKNDRIEWTDAGGKYKFEDCDIYTTISREFSEELYYSTSISRDHIMRIKNTHTPVYVNGHQNQPVYICYIVHTDELEKYNIKMNPELFYKNRRATLFGNPNVPVEYYNSVMLKHIPFNKIKSESEGESINLSYRLRRILKYGTISSKLLIKKSDAKNIHNQLVSIPKRIDIGGENNADKKNKI